MNVRIKTVVAIGITLLGLLSILYVAYVNIVAQNVTRLEVEDTTNNIDRALVALNDDVLRLNITVGDWAPWDDTYQFVLDGNSDYVDSNLSAATLANLQLNLMAFVNNDGQLVYGTDLDLLTGSEAALPSSLNPHIQAGSPLVSYIEPTDNVSGLLMVDGQPLLVAALPITTSEQLGPIHGALVMGRWLNASVIDELMHRTQLRIEVFPYSNLVLPEDVASAKVSLLSDDDLMHVAIRNEEFVAGYTLVSDIYGEPGIILKVESPRTAYAQARTSQTYFIVALLVAGLAFGTVTFLSLERIVLARLAHLDRNVREIGDTGNLAARVQVSGRDEVSTLAASVNLMLGSLEKSRLHELESQERYRAVVEQTSEGIILYDADTKQLIEANNAFLVLLGYTLEKALSLTLYDVIAESQDSVNTLVDTVVSQGRNFMGDRPCYRADGTTVWVEVAANLIILGKPVICMVVRDITERRQAEDIRLMSERRFRALVENSMEAITLFDIEGNVLYDSPASPGLLGYGSEELIGVNVFSYIHPDDAPDIILQLQQVRQEQSARLKSIFRFRHKSGAWRWLEASGRNLLNDPSVHAIVVNYRDITERVRAEQEIQQHAARAVALVRVAARLNAQLDLSHVLQAVCEETSQALQMPATSLKLYDETGQALVVAATYGLPEEFDHQAEIFWNEDIRPQAKTVGSILSFENVQAVPGLPNAHIYTDLDIHSFVTTTLNRDGQTIGYLSANTFIKARELTNEELELLQGLADLAAQAIVNARLYDQNIRQLERLMALNTTARKLTQTYHFEELASEVVRTCVDGFGAQLAWLGQVRPNGQVGTLAVHGGMSTMLENTPIVWNELRDGNKSNGNGSMMSMGYPFAIADLANEVAATPWQQAALAQGFHSVLALPLVARDDPFGALLLFNERADAFTNDQMAFLMIYANQVATALENSRLYTETVRRLQLVKTLRAIDTAIISSTDLNLTLNTILAEITSQLNIDAASILLFNPSSQLLEYSTGRGFRVDALRHTRLRLGQGYAGRAALERRIVFVPDLNANENKFSQSLSPTRNDFRAYYGIPLIAHGQIKGVLEIFLHHMPDADDVEWVELLEALASQTAIAIDNSALLDGLQRANTELVVAYDATIEGWSSALDLRDKETEGHTQRVTRTTIRLARAMGVGDAQLMHLWRGALLHDIGKMGIPDAILLKPGPLTDEEWEIMRQHPDYARNMLAPIAYLRPALDIPYCHHEKWDGTGYPRGLKGEDIPLAARIFAVVDVWDALSFDRPYRMAWSADKVKQHIREQAGRHFDPQIVDLFLNMLNELC